MFICIVFYSPHISDIMQCLSLSDFTMHNILHTAKKKKLQRFIFSIRLPWWLRSKEPTRQLRRLGLDHPVAKISWRRKWQPTPILLTWRIPWTEEPGGLQSMGSQKNQTWLKSYSLSDKNSGGKSAPGTSIHSAHGNFLLKHVSPERTHGWTLI